jgi:hypothetical protein
MSFIAFVPCESYMLYYVLCMLLNGYSIINGALESIHIEFIMRLLTLRYMFPFSWYYCHTKDFQIVTQIYSNEYLYIGLELTRSESLRSSFLLPLAHYIWTIRIFNI